LDKKSYEGYVIMSLEFIDTDLVDSNYDEDEAVKPDATSAVSYSKR
jgi:hypothetical protein